jgi:predicted nucleotidyltransferase
MSTLGFTEAYNYYLAVLIRKNPELIVKIPMPAGIVLMKIISWHEKYPGRSKDALDIIEIINHYDEYDNMERFHTEHADIITNAQYDYKNGFARLLGRDMAKIAKPDTMKILV